MRMTISPFVTIASSLALVACTSTYSAGDGSPPDGGPPDTGGQRAPGTAGQGGATGTGGQGEGPDGAGRGGASAIGGGGASATGGGGEMHGGTGGAGGSGGALAVPSRGSAVVLSPDESFALTVNRDVGSVTLLRFDRSQAGAPPVSAAQEIPVGVASEPWQVVVAPDNDTGYVVLRKDQKVVRLRYLKTKPVVDGWAAVGSEPTSLALSPSGARLYVSNWNDGTVSVVGTQDLRVIRTIDLNAALVGAGYLGTVASRAALAHPRSLTVSNDADGDDSDEGVYVTEFFGQQRAPEAADGSNADVRNVGLVYRVSLADDSVKVIELGALADIGFKDANGVAAGCFPNQLQSITLNGPYAYVLSVCASPKGPLGVKATTTACQVVDDCATLGLVDPACVVPTAGGSAICIDLAGVKTTTAPVLSVVDTRTAQEIPGSARSLNAAFQSFFEKAKVPLANRRFPLFASDLSFVPNTTVGYVSANGADAVFRLVFDADMGTLTEVGSPTSPFIDLNPAGIDASKAGKNPVGFASAGNASKFGVSVNDVSRNVSLVDFNTQAVAGGVKSPNVVTTAAQPAPKSQEEHVLRGKRFFDTGTGRWSLAGQGWGACQSCHADGLSDNVTWYFARGPRQSTSLEGSFASKNPSDQRIFNWTAIFDEVDDFEGNTRDISGGVGAIVSAVSAPPQTADRLDFVGLKHAGLNGSSRQISDPANPLGLDPGPKLEDWKDIEAYIQTIRSPRAPSNLDVAAVARGKTLFASGGSCQGCHGGAKWTISQRFYTPGTETNTKLNSTPLAIPGDFPKALLPAVEAANQNLRFNGGNAAALDQILCAIRPVGTFNVAEAGTGVAELRADMKTVAQGNGTPEGEGRGYNPPSLLGMAAGAPFLHAGNTRTLEALFSGTFQQHFRSLAPNFLAESDPTYVRGQVSDLVQYLLSIDEDTTPVAIPEPGAAGGLLCPSTF